MRVEVDVELDQFDDDEILEAALDIIKSGNKVGYEASLIREIKAALAVPDEEADWPRSTASLVTDMADYVRRLSVDPCFRRLADIPATAV